MKHELIERLLAGQYDCAAVWQLRSAGWSRKAAKIRLRGSGLRPVAWADGVWTATRGQLSDRQRWAAAALTAPDTHVHDRSASLLWAFGDRWPAERVVSVVRRGRGGPRRHGEVLVRRSEDLPDESLTRHLGIPVTTAARTLVDVAGKLDDRGLRRALLEALRLQVMSIDGLRAEIRRRPNAKGAGRLLVLLGKVEGLPVARCRSNAEATALLRRREAGRPDVAVNEKVGRFEADLIDHERRIIYELDSRRWHLDPELDAEKTADWEGEGFTVERRSTDDPYDPGTTW